MPALSELSPAISRGIRFLVDNKAPDSSPSAAQRRGGGPPDWPHFLSAGIGPFKPPFPDTNPFAAATLHHALSAITPETTSTLGLDPGDLAHVRECKARALRIIDRFRVANPPGAFGYWYRNTVSHRDRCRLGRQLTLILLKGPVLKGPLAPARSQCYPADFQIWPDADSTALAYVALAEQARAESSPLPALPIAAFANWRDDGRFPRGPPKTLPAQSGTFLTWFAPADAKVPNVSDLVVNANVLFAFGRFGQGDNPVAATAVDWLKSATSDLSAVRSGQLSTHYSFNYAAHYAVSRTYRDGGVMQLRPAVEAFADDVARTARRAPEGVYWPSKDPALSTAHALLTLLNADRRLPLMPAAASYLLQRQNPESGAWNARWQDFTATESGVRLYFKSDAYTTALALEALIRYTLWHPIAGVDADPEPAPSQNDPAAVSADRHPASG